MKTGIEPVKDLLIALKEDVKGLDPEPPVDYKLMCNDGEEVQSYIDGYVEAKHAVIDLILECLSEMED